MVKQIFYQIYAQATFANKPVSCKLKYLQNINNHQLTMVTQHIVAIWPYHHGCSNYYWCKAHLMVTITQSLMNDS